MAALLAAPEKGLWGFRPTGGLWFQKFQEGIICRAKTKKHTFRYQKSLSLHCFNILDLMIQSEGLKNP